MEVNRAEEGDGTFSDLHAQLATLALRTDGKLRSFLRRFERDPQLVDDLVQDVYVEVLKSLRNFGGRSCLESWIFGVAQNVGRQHVAKAVAHRARFVDMEDGPADTRGAPMSFTSFPCSSGCGLSIRRCAPCPRPCRRRSRPTSKRA